MKKNNICVDITIIKGGDLYKEMYNIIYNKIKFNKIKKSMRIETNYDTIEWLNTVNSYIYKMSKIDKTVLYIYDTIISYY